MSGIDKHIKDLIQFYVKENYKHYLTKNNINHINEPEIEGVVSELYEHLVKHNLVKTCTLDQIKELDKLESF